MTGLRVTLGWWPVPSASLRSCSPSRRPPRRRLQRRGRSCARRGGPGAADRVERHEFDHDTGRARRRRQRPQRSPPMATARPTPARTTDHIDQLADASTTTRARPSPSRLRRRPGAPPSPTSVTRRPSGSSNPSTCRIPGDALPAQYERVGVLRALHRGVGRPLDRRDDRGRGERLRHRRAPARDGLSAGAGWSRSARTTPPTWRSAACRI